MNEVLSRLKEIASAVMYAAEASEAESVLQRIAEVARELVACRYAALGVPDGRGGLRYFKTVGMTPEEVALLEHMPRGHGLIGALMRERQSIRLERMQDDARSVGFPAHHPPMTSFLGVPVHLGHQLFGMLYLCDREDGQHFDERDQLLVETLAGYAALVISGSNLSQQRNRLTLLEERERIGMELHDGVIQSLYGVGMQVELLRSGGSTIAPDSLKNIVEGLNDVIEEIRGFITDLRYRSDGRQTVRDCIQVMLTRLHLPETIHAEIDAPETRPPFSPAVFESICLIVNEAISNAIRHADATRIRVRVQQDKYFFSVLVNDDGQGFDTSILKNGSGGLGLHNMKRRARLYGGDVSIDTAPGRGTTLNIQIPVRAY
ncbi:MAG: GAF domain-containing sensor histidine kinase [Anaerolineae bacterium]|nr:GAF domain-containing sensor histidine kinase [Anaerolineae bacterium]